MASIHKEVAVQVDSATAWNALRRVADAHQLFRPVLTNARLEGDTRTATFANGMVVHERILDVDDNNHRVAYTVTDAPGMTYHHPSMEVIDRGPGHCQFVWITDFLPPEVNANIAPLMDQGLAALKSNLEAQKR